MSKDEMKVYLLNWDTDTVTEMTLERFRQAFNDEAVCSENTSIYFTEAEALQHKDYKGSV